MDKKVCPFMTSAFQYDDHTTDMGQIQYCIERLCMAWGVIKPYTYNNEAGKEILVLRGCKLIDKEI